MMKQDAVKLTYPCSYSIRVVAITTLDIKIFIKNTVKKYDPHFNEVFDFNSSKNGKYLSVRFSITATGEAQIKALDKALKKNSAIQIIL